MKVLLVYDEQLQLIRLESAVKKALPPETETLCYSNPVKALEENAETKFDVAFLDIEMPKINGIQLAKKLKAVNPAVNIIFVTAYNDYALDAYKMHASGYITKPVNENKVKEEMEGLRHPVELKRANRLYVKCFGNFEVFSDGVPLKFQRSKSKNKCYY